MGAERDQPAPDQAARDQAEARDQAAVIDFLSKGAAFGLPEEPVERVETHAALIFLVADRAYKMKRAVRYSFLDFTTLERRRAVLEDEYRLNVKTAPKLYRGVLAVTRDEAGRLAVDGQGDPVEWLLEMARFDQAALFDRLAERGRLDLRLMTALADAVADLHAVADRRARGGYAAMTALVDGNESDLAVTADQVGRQDQAAELIAATRSALRRHRDLLDERNRTGFVRRCHGDLHLGNIVLRDERPVLFDCLEFDEALASIDVFYDLAFLLMDLCHRRLDELAVHLFNAYLERTWDDPGCALLPVFSAIRATIRAKIEAFEIATAGSDRERAQHREAAGQYLDLGLRLLSVEAPRLIAIGGLSGSGKSTIARRLAGRLGSRRWAAVLRSDVIRKRLHGMEPNQPLGDDAYSAASSAEVYGTLEDRARTLLRAGRTVIADATFLDPAARSAIEAVATAASVPFHGIRLEAPEAVLAARIAGRKDDASDASLAVLRKQLQRDIGAMTWQVIDAGPAAADVALSVHRHLSR